MSEHTPGPWQANAYSSVVGLPVSAQPDPKENTIIICGVRGDRATAEANARVIAAAPELLAALKELADLQQFANGFENGVEYNGIQEAEYWHGQTMERVKAAITKAEGRS